MKWKARGSESIKTHKVKSWPREFKEITENGKRFEVRVNDRDYRPGDFLILREWDPRTKEYSGREAKFRITNMLQGRFGLKWLLLIIISTLCIMYLGAILFCKAVNFWNSSF